MKTTFVFQTILVLLVSITLNAQTTQIKEATSFFNQNNPKAALSILGRAEYLITNATANDKSDFYFLKARAHKKLSDDKVDVVQNLTSAVNAYQELIAEEVSMEQIKYSIKAKEAINAIKNDLRKSAVNDSQAGRVKECSEKLYNLYKIDTRDTINLFHAAKNYYAIKDYDNAAKGFNELVAIKYKGKGVEYFAVNVATNVEEVFDNAISRDESVKLGLHIKSRNFVSPPKVSEIQYLLGNIYFEKAQLDNAINSYIKATEADQKNMEAYVSLAYAFQDKRKLLDNEMSMLGVSEAEMKKYDELAIKKEALVEKTINYLELANKLDDKNIEIVKMLLNSYRAINLNDKYGALKSKYKL